jgi:hypothetical protein
MKRTAATILALGLLSCGPAGSGSPEPVIAVFDPGSESLFDVPFPSEVRRSDDGSVDVSLFPNPRGIRIVDQLVDLVGGEMTGFGTSSAIYVTFSGPIDVGSLPPTPSISRGPGSSVVLMNVDAESAYAGERVPFTWHYRETVSDFWSPHTLAVLPVRGWVLRGDTTYALLVTDAVRGASGLAVERDEGFERLVDDEPAAGGLFSPLERSHRSALERAESEGVDAGSVVSAAVFRTTDPVGEMVALRDHVTGEVDAPEVIDLAVHEERDGSTVYTGHYGPNPNYQHGFSEGLSPYESEGGWIDFHEDGVPVLDGHETMRLCVTVPGGPVPPGGWPTVLYAHGTGGDYLSATRNGVADELASEGIAVVGIDNAMNGARIPEDASAETLFFNVGNIRASRDNVRQAAVDVIQLERLVPLLEIDEETSADGRHHAFSSADLAYMGHSQGGLNGALVLAVSDGFEAAVLSGAGGGLLYSLTHKTEPYEIRNLMGIVMGFTGSTEELDEEDFGVYHPALNLAQMFLEPADGTNYARHWHREPLAGVRAKSVLMTEGMDDSYAPPQTIECLAAAARLSPVEPVVELVPAMSLAGLEPLMPPVSGNCALGGATCGLTQYPADEAYDGHFVAFHHEGCIATWRGFLEMGVAGDLPVIGSP